jgi:hypothetical protein
MENSPESEVPPDEGSSSAASEDKDECPDDEHEAKGTQCLATEELVSIIMMSKEVVMPDAGVAVMPEMLLPVMEGLYVLGLRSNDNKEIPNKAEYVTGMLPFPKLPFAVTK